MSRRKKRATIVKLFIVTMKINNKSIFQELFVASTKHGVKSNEKYKQVKGSAEKQKGKLSISIETAVIEGSYEIAARVKGHGLLPINV